MRKNWSVFKLKLDFRPYFSAKVFNVTPWTSFILKIYMLHYVKKYMGQLRFFGTQKKNCLWICKFLKIFDFYVVITQNHLFLKNFLWHLFSHFLPYFGIKILVDHNTHILAWELTIIIHPKKCNFLRMGFWGVTFCPFGGENIKSRFFFAENNLTLCQFE